MSSATAPGAARAFASVELLGLPLVLDERQIDDIVLVVSELATNAVEAGSPTVHLTLEMHRDRVRVTVTDSGAGEPAVQPPSATRPFGRGLFLVEQLSVEWGFRAVADGKEVWATLVIPAQPDSLYCTV